MDLKQKTIEHLNNISNQESKVHWLNGYTIKELITEVENDSIVGREYMQRFNKYLQQN